MQYNGDYKRIDKKQKIDQLINITLWHQEIEPHQEGAREKNKVFCPKSYPFSFLINEHLYLFKQSSPRYPAQFWIEIIASRLGCLIGVPVPPAFIAIDENRNIAGALIEWFYNYPGNLSEIYTRGG